MVGQTIAQFVAVECKTERYRRTTEEQDNFLGQVAVSGGAAYLARGDGTAEVDLIAVESD
jgi:predicted nucleic acid-binding protein